MVDRLREPTDVSDELPIDFGFGAPPAPDPPPDNVIPFPRMRPSSRLGDAWAAEVSRLNESSGTKYQLQSPLAAVPSLMAKRTMPSMWWPDQWSEMSRRCRTYVGECVGISGAIGGGKTSFALQLAVANTGHGHPCLWAPLELDNEQCDLRIVANMHAVGMPAVREEWSEERIRHALVAVDDLWHYIDHCDEPEQQFAAIEDAIGVAWRVYRVPPVVVVDHLGELVAEERDDRAALRRWAHRFRKLAVRTNSYIILLNQVSKGNQAITTGKIDIGSASDALGIEMGSQAIASAVANNIVLVAFKADDTPELDAHALIAKARNTGIEGRVGMRFRKSGGVWKELGYLPATPSQERAAIEADKKDKHRVTPVRSPQEARADINAAQAGDAAAMRRVKMLESVTRHGMLGIELTELRKVYGVGRGAMFMQALQELERVGSCERIGTRVRVIARME